MIRKKYIAAAIVAVWFLGVDSSWFVHDCPDCGYGKDVTQYRLFTIPVRETTRESPTIAQHVAIDLGVPCMHKNSTQWHKHRWWGLLVCKSPCINGVYRLIDDDSWYDPEASVKVAALGTDDNSVTNEFVENVFDKHDYSFVQTVLDRAGVASKPAK